MKIDKVIERYLIEGRQEDFDKWVKVVKSCKTVEQLNSAIRMGQNLYAKYGEKWWDDNILNWDTPFLDKLTSIWKNKKEQLSHEDAQKILKEIN